MASLYSTILEQECLLGEGEEPREGEWPVGEDLRPGDKEGPDGEDCLTLGDARFGEGEGSLECWPREGLGEGEGLVPPSSPSLSSSSFPFCLSELWNFCRCLESTSIT